MTVFTLDICMCEGVGEDSGHGTGESHSHPWHVDIWVGMCKFLLECVKWHCMCTYVESSPCRNYSLLGIAHLVVGPYFKCKWYPGGRRSFEAVILKEARIWI